jgi:hypothetical protein
MKLYTEEQLRQAYIDGMDFIAVDPTMYEQDADEYMRDMHSIELPSDEEIENESESIFYNDRKFKPTIYEIMALRIGAKWMRDKITNIENK